MDGLIVAAIFIAAIMITAFFLGPVAYRHDRRLAQRRNGDDAGSAVLASGAMFASDGGGSGCSDGGGSC